VLSWKIKISVQNGTFNNISITYVSFLLLWKSENQEKTSGLSQVTDDLYRIVMFRVHRTIYQIEQVKILRPPWSVIIRCALVATSADSVPSSNLVRITIAPIGTTSEIFNEGGINIISLSNIRPITIYFHLSQCRLIPYLHQRSIFFKANSIRSSIVAILELFRGAQCLIEVIRSSGEEMWRVDAYQIPYYSRGIEEAKRTQTRFADWFDVLSFRLHFTLLWSENLHSDGHHFYQYQQNEQSLLTLFHWMQKRPRHITLENQVLDKRGGIIGQSILKTGFRMTIHIINKR
jgi:hypothetical protein